MSGKPTQDKTADNKPSNHIHRIGSDECSNSNAETCSVASESSAAIVSLYNSWSSVDTNTSQSAIDSLDGGVGAGDEDDSCILNYQYSFVPDIGTELKRRLPPADFPSVPRIRKRKRPNCRFLMFMGSRLPPLPFPSPPPVNPINPLNDLGLDEKDAFFPLVEESKDKNCGGKDEEVENDSGKSSNNGNNNNDAPATLAASDGSKNDCKNNNTLSSGSTKDINPKIST